MFMGAAQPVLAAQIIASDTSISSDVGGVTLTLGLSNSTPFSVYTLDNPRRLLIDMGDTELENLPAGLGADIPEVAALRHGLFQLGEARIVLDLSVPLVVHSAHSTRTPSGREQIAIRLARASAAKFAANSASPDGNVWQRNQVEVEIEGQDGLPIIAIDAGHGGVDLGAQKDDVHEKTITLQFAEILRNTLLEDGRFRVVMTRTTDVFIPLGERVEIARRAGADAFISLHADVVTLGRARGTTVFSLSETSEDQEAITIATLENRADLVAGISAEGEDDQITQVLLQMAHRETDALSNRFADVLAESLWFQNDLEIKSRRMSAGFRVLRAPEIPSVLVELGFMSDASDLEKLQDPEWQLGMSEALRSALVTWLEVEAEMRGLLRN